jgi:hypothetical protein
MIYQFKPGYRIAGVKAQDVGEVLSELRDKHERLETTTVLQAAKRKRSRIHNAFEWDDKVAGHEYRLEQARRLIRSLQVVMEEGDEPAFVHVKIDNAGYYQSSSVAARNIDEWDLVRGSCLRYLQSASEALDKLDAIAERTNREDAGGVRRVKTIVEKAHEQLRSS